MKLKREDMLKWNVKSSEEPGRHTVITPDIHECVYTHIDRLNLTAGENYTVESGEYEYFLSLIEGKAVITVEGKDAEDMSRLDGLYLAGNTVCTLRAEENCVFYIAYALYEGVGETLHIRFDPNAPLGPMHEVHGEGTFQREVFIMLGDKTPASRLLCGYTFGPDSGWTSWPPHEHAAMLEETYCYFDMPAPKMGYQITYLEENGLYSDAVAHPVRSGNMVVFPCGYHPTVASPGTRNTYLWALVALRPEDRVYGIYNKDKNYI